MNAARRNVSSGGPATSTQTANMVFGIGDTGLSIARYLQRRNIDAVYVDSRSEPPGLEQLKELAPDAEIILGRLARKNLKGIERIVVSPGIADSDAMMEQARKANVDIVSDIEIFVAEVDADFVAVTGSNGKSTVTTLLALMCEAAGIRALAGANLGQPALDLLAEEKPDLYVLELSSFHLQRTPHLPARVAILLNVSPDHLDWHQSEDEYRQAKYRIFADALSAVFNRDDAEAEAGIPDGIARISFGLDVPADGQYGIVNENGADYLARGTSLLLATSELVLVGVHNQLNALAALAAGELIGIDLSAMLLVLHEFPGLPHRMQFVARVGNVDYINDSKATNVAAAIASVCSLRGPVVLIAGGQGKGGDFDHLAQSISDNLRVAVLIGEDAESIAAALDGLSPTHRCPGLSEAVVKASQLARPGDTVLLAPACASFDQFENYQVRGERFCDSVRELAA
jgi:UDP-N-acetylmuramoylalanine--D-glutamate ligase